MSASNWKHAICGCFSAFLALSLAFPRASHAVDQEVGRGPVYSVVELTFTGPSQGPTNTPARDIDFWVRFQHESGSPTYKIHGFWDGDGVGSTAGNVFKVRFCPTAVGKWKLVEVSSNQASLLNQKENDYVVGEASTNKGFWLPESRWYKRSNGSHQYIVGNTHYDFLSKPNGSEASTSSIQTDINSNATYFKKLRFCLMSFRPENTSSLRTFFDTSGNPSNVETERPNPKFFRERVDVAVQRGFTNDLICDLIMGGTEGDQVANLQPYLRYVVARYGAYPNVWFCLANEWDEQTSASAIVTTGNFMRSVMAYPSPLSAHGLGGWNTGLNGSWHDHTIRQTKTGNLASAADAMGTDVTASGGKPAVNDENGYDPNEQTSGDVIEGITGSFSGGGYGSTGHKSGSKTGGYFWGHAARGTSITEHPSINSLKFLREKIDQHVSFWQMSPKKETGSIFSNVTTGFRVLEWPGNQYVLASDAADSTVTATLPSGTWTVVRLDVVARTEQVLSSSASGTYNFATPNSRASLTVFKKNGTVSLPSVPTALAAAAASSSQINLSWTDNSNNEDGFAIERSPNGTSSWSPITTVAPNITTNSNTGLTASTTYYYRVRAYNTAGNSAYSNVANATTQSAGATTITAPTFGTVFAPLQQVIATGTGTNLSWSIDRIGDTSGAFATGTGSTLTFTVPGDSTSAQDIQVTLTGTGGTATRTYDILDTQPVITTVSADLTAATAGDPYTDDLEATGGQPPLTWTVTNLPPGLAVAANGGEISGTPTIAGTYTIHAKVTDQDGDFSQKDLTLVVNNPSGAVLTVVSVSNGKNYSKGVAVAGSTFYIDRTYTLTTLSPGLANGELVRTANDDKFLTTATHLTLNSTDTVRLYLAYDNRATTLPSWLSSWTPAPTEFVTTNIPSGGFNIYTKLFPAGTIVIPANANGSPVGEDAHYFIIAK